jgi:uncharacterized protein (UPF0548 family)
VFVVGRPTVDGLERVLSEQASERVTYAEVRATQGRLPEGPNRFGFAYGTLPAHPEQGEEAFHIESDVHGTVRFVVTAFSRPRHPLARIGSPVARQVQLRVTRRYLTSLAEFVAGG